MSGEHELARYVFEDARKTFIDEVIGITLDEALDAGDGLRSILGLMKHTAGWTDVYRSFAFDEVPLGWTDIEWPRGLRQQIEPTRAYLDEMRTWFEAAAEKWLAALEPPVDLAESRPVHWGECLPLGEIVALAGGHISYHAGEINMILAIRRREAWEYGEHVEENHITTLGHSVRRPWMSDEDVRRHEEDMRNAAGEP